MQIAGVSEGDKEERERCRMMDRRGEFKNSRVKLKEEDEGREK